MRENISTPPSYDALQREVMDLRKRVETLEAELNRRYPVEQSPYHSVSNNYQRYQDIGVSSGLMRPVLPMPGLQQVETNLPNHGPAVAVVSDEVWEELMEMSLNPPEPTQALRDLMSRK